VKHYQYLSANNIKDLVIHILESLLRDDERKRRRSSAGRYHHEIQAKLTNQLVKVGDIIVGHATA
jgi:precorrin-6B methylase 1